MPAKAYKLRKSRGLGDSIERVMKTTGISTVVEKVSEVTGKPCNCKQRRDALNKQFPYKDNK